jgi:hypothetical protein
MRGLGRGSMWSTLSTLLAKRGKSCMILNGAVGSTGMVHNWAGYILPWSGGPETASMMKFWLLSMEETDSVGRGDSNTEINAR